MKTKYKEDFPLDLLNLKDETYQSRFDYDQGKIENLAKDIDRFGQREPIGIRPQKRRFQIIYGFQRVKAIQLLGRATIKAQIYEEISQRECSELSVRDNEMHGDLTEIEKALQCKRLKDESWTIVELCAAFNTKKSTVYNWLKVAELDKITLGLIHHDYLSVYHGLEISKIEVSRRLETLKMAVGWDLSVRDLQNWRRGKGIHMRLGVNGWISNCWRDLRWKTVDDCKGCEFFQGLGEKDGRSQVHCSACEKVQHPEALRDFLSQLYRGGS